VYKEGSRFVESQPRSHLAKIALKYIVKEKEVAILRESLANKDMDETQRQDIVRLLDAGGVRTALQMF
jgi:glutamate dehydrogenase